MNSVLSAGSGRSKVTVKEDRGITLMVIIFIIIMERMTIMEMIEIQMEMIKDVQKIFCYQPAFDEW